MWIKDYDKHMTEAICAGDAETIKKLIEHGSSVNKENVLNEFEMDGKAVRLLTTPMELAFSKR